MTPVKDHALYQVSLKVLIKKGDEFLFLKTSGHKLLDLPGGRIDVSEHDVPIEKIIAREVQEELGKEIKYKLGKPVFQFRRATKTKNIPCFITVYETEYLSGDVQLSDEHDNYRWMDPRKIGFEEKIFFSKEERLAFEAYFDNL